MEVVLKPKPPFDFGLTLEIYQRFNKDLVDHFDGQTYSRVLLAKGKLFLTQTTCTSSIENPKLKVKIEPELNTSEQILIKEKLSSMLGISDDIKTFYNLSKKDPIMNRIIQVFYGMRTPTTETVFEALIIAISEQQIALPVAVTLRSRLVQKYGKNFVIGNKTYYAFPAAINLAKAKPSEIRNLKFSQKKAETIVHVAQLVTENKLDLEAMKNLPKDKVLEELIKISGIGPWSVNYVMARGMRRGEALPAADLAIRSAITNFYGLKNKATEKDVEKILATYKNYQNYAAYYLIRAYADKKFQERFSRKKPNQNRKAEELPYTDNP